VLKPWEEILGVRIACEEVAWADYFEHMRLTQSHIFTFGWIADYPDPDNFLRICLREMSDWQHEGYEALIGEARHSMDHDHRFKLFRQAEEILVQEAPIMPYTYQVKHALVKPWMRNYRVNPMDQEWPTFHHIVIEPH